MPFHTKKQSQKKKCINLFNPSPDIFQRTFPNELITELSEWVDYWRPTGDIERLISNDYFFRELLQEGEILITGWGTPKLPFDLLHKGRLNYICHVTGTIKPFIDKKFLEAGYQITNWGNSISQIIAEAALMLILVCLRKLRYVSRQLEAGYWDQLLYPPVSLWKLRVGLLGFGTIAQDLVKLLHPFKVRLQAYDPFVDQTIFQQFKVKRVTSLKTLFAENDVISLHAGMTEALEAIVNKDLLGLMPDDGILVNTARGGLINEDDLITELQKGRLWCGLDVFSTEPLSPDSPLRYLSRCVITPHNAGPTQNSYDEMGKYALQNIRRYLGGEPLLSRITLEMYDRIT